MSIIKTVETINLTGPVSATKALDKSDKPQGADFNTYLKQALGEVNTLQQKADQAIQQLVAEGTGDLQDTMIALEKADVSFKLMMQIRNKVLEAYQEILRMQV